MSLNPPTLSVATMVQNAPFRIWHAEFLRIDPRSSLRDTWEWETDGNFCTGYESRLLKPRLLDSYTATSRDRIIHVSTADEIIENERQPAGKSVRTNSRIARRPSPYQNTGRGVPRVQPPIRHVGKEGCARTNRSDLIEEPNSHLFLLSAMSYVLRRTLYVGNLAYDVGWQALKDHFKSAGHVVHADVITEAGTGRSKVRVTRCMTRLLLHLHYTAR